jgi:hypothetical protein
MKPPALILFAAALAMPDAAFAQDDPAPEAATAEGVLRAYHERIERALGIHCLRGEGDEVVVCGSAVETRRQALPFGSRPEPGARIGPVAGEPPSAMAALNAGQCISRCQSMVGVDVGSAVQAIGRGLGRLLHPD